jgi:hypothetical protein
MRRGALEVVVNFGDDPLVLEVDSPRLLFASGPGVGLRGARLSIPAHSGALVGPVVEAG